MRNTSACGSIPCTACSPANLLRPYSPSGAVGALGGFVIPKAFGSSIALTGRPAGALMLFVGFYLSCIAITWWHYGRRFAPARC